MKSWYSALLMLMSLILLSACGSPSSTRVELSSNLSFLTIDHEVIFLGRHYSTNTKFSVISEAEKFDMDLLLGKWEFAILAWEKTGSRFTGTPRCFVTTDQEITKSTTVLTLDIKASSCDHEFFRKPGFLDSTLNEFQTLKVKANGSLSSIVSPTSLYALPTGFSAYKLILKDSGGRFLASDCSAFGATTPIKFPAFGRVYLEVAFQVFSDATCSSFTKSIRLPEGISDHPAISRVFDLADETIVYLGNETPSIVANNTIQLVISSITDSAPVNRTLTFLKPNHYSGAVASQFGTIIFPPNTVQDPIKPSVCTVAGTCSLHFVATIPSGYPIDRLVFQYTLKDADGNESNSAIAIACSGLNSSCKF